MTVAEAVVLTSATLRDAALAQTVIQSISALENAAVGSAVFVESRKYAGLLAGIRAAAVFCKPDTAEHVPEGVAALITPQPQAAFAALGRVLHPNAVRPDPLTGETGVSPAAHVSPSAMIEPGVVIEAGAVVGPGAGIGTGTVIAPGAVIAAGSQIGRDCHVGPGASIQNALIGNRVLIHAGVRIGQDGFGFVPGRRGLEKMPQIGRVVIQDDVEVGANTAIDRGALDDTVIGEGTKIDNLVQIAHNVKIGRMCVIAGQCGISGSVTIGDFVMLGGGVGIKDHIAVGNGAQIAARSALMRDVPPGEKWGGVPALPLREFFRQITALQALGRNGKE